MSCILIINDNPNSLGLTVTFGSETDQVFEAFSVVQASRMLVNNRIDAVVVMDGNLSNEERETLLGSAWKTDPTISFVFLSRIENPKVCTGAHDADAIQSAIRRACDRTRFLRECMIISEFPQPFDLAEFLAETEKKLIQQILAASGRVQAEAARRMGLSRSALSYKLAKYGIPSARQWVASDLNKSREVDSLTPSRTYEE